MVADVQMTARKRSPQPTPRRRTTTTMSRADGRSPEVEVASGDECPSTHGNAPVMIVLKS